MTTSGTITFDMNTSEIITDALELLGVVGEGNTLQNYDYNSCLRSLNMMVKSWQEDGIFVTHESEATIFLITGQRKYQLGGTSPARTGQDSTIIETKLSSDKVATDTSIDVTDTTGMTILDPVGIVLDDGTTHWTTVASITDSDTFVLTVALPSAAASGNYCFSYSTAMGRPLHIESVLLRTSGGTDDELVSQLQERKLHELSKSYYKNVSNKGQQGLPVQFYQDRQNNYTDLYVWPTPSNENNRLKVVYKRVIEDFSSAADTADLPQSSKACLAYNLAAYVAPKYGKEEKAALAIAPIASQLLNNLRSNLQEKTSFRIIPRIK